MVRKSRSEGLPERDISSLGVMGWGLASAENSSAAAAVAVVAPWVGWGVCVCGTIVVFLINVFVSPSGPRTEIWTRYCREIAQNCVARIFGLGKNRKNTLTCRRQINL